MSVMQPEGACFGLTRSLDLLAVSDAIDPIARPLTPVGYCKDPDSISLGGVGNIKRKDLQVDSTMTLSHPGHFWIRRDPVQVRNYFSVKALP